MNSIPGKESLKRAIGVRSLTLAILNITVGTGIFVIPAIVAGSLGPAAIIAYLVCGALIFLIALCFAELASRATVSGGVYKYIEAAFGPYAGFLANNLYWLGASVIPDAALANALADTLTIFFPFLSIAPFRILFFVLVFTGLAVLNIRSVRHGIRLIELATFGKLIPLVVLVVAGAGFISVNNLAWASFPPIDNIGAACLLLFYAFMGVETPLSNGGEVRDVKRTVPLAIFLGIACVLILYMSIQLVTQGVLGATIATHKNAPLAAVAGIIFGKAGLTLMIVATALSILGALGGEILSMPRILYAGARDGLMPKVLARVHPRFSTPYIAIPVYASLGLVFAIFGAFRQLAIISSASMLIIYFGSVLATLKLRKTGTSTPEKTFRVPVGFIIPTLAAAVILWLLSNLAKKELIGIAIFIALLSLIYFLIAFLKKRTLSQVETKGLS